ncbi:ChlI component of cobalt chelatase involved in B12 biosynthesis / ChlD component of cobalt chelatase involved in B12 biosynthesis [Acidisarcina polymorpha]|uniref:ChlI component of cobalt chelatase involved in B12 biosynthesis / ChlD component of cobalt chelatase involved in B12 biosynthesis n=1 Tax=Acidisarcina polymorpha TaxID=2211140 RepID=A0A2Z5G600_9BACT|nr:ATP-binding protein [Acidisarcina polymorpha]AXC14410.1 ChlI component of cobalt chelatase involved in B12 biosynthesis / ChlD component of cobalt chelatase involved in B12 biosynthesis [Acidisarcina polymorpha]
MRPATYPFAAIVGQSEMKLALLLAAVDWRLGVLLRGDKGSGKTTTARALAALLPAPAPFINLPVGATEDRLLGGLHLEQTLKGNPVLKPGMLSEAHGGVLYVDEVNLLPGHLGDALLDAAASGVHVLERDGFSASHPAQFVLLGSMNPEEGSLRPQLLDRFALSVTVAAPVDLAERRLVLEHRIAFEHDPVQFTERWSGDQQGLRNRIAAARAALDQTACSSAVLGEISAAVCERGVRSMRADLAVVRAAIAYAALNGDASVESLHVAAVLPLALNHRLREGVRSSTPQYPPQAAPQQPSPPENAPDSGAEPAIERIFPPRLAQTPAIEANFSAVAGSGGRPRLDASFLGPVAGNRRSSGPVELDLLATLSHSLRETGSAQPRLEDLQERVRKSRAGTRYLFVIDSSGSHAAQQKMRTVKGAISSLLTRSFKRDDEVAMVVFRGVSAEVLLEPTQVLADAFTKLEYLPTGGRTPLAAALDLARNLVTPSTLLILLTDGRANIPLHGGDAWQEAAEIAAGIHCKAIVVDTESAGPRVGRCTELAEMMGARYLTLGELGQAEDAPIEIAQARNGR